MISILIVFPLILSVVESANILFLLPVPSPSHRIWNNVIIEELAARGHNLTILTVEHELSTSNIHYIQMEKVYEGLETFENVGYKSFGLKSPFRVIKDTYYFYNFVSQQMFASSGIQILANYSQNFQFDAIVHDFSLGQSLLAFVEHFQNPPLISVSPFNIPSYIYAVSATHIFPSYMPHYATDFSSDMNIIERLKNSLYHLFDWFYRKYIYMKNENRRCRKYFPNNKLSLEEIEQKTDLVLTNSDFVLDYVHSLPPNVIEVGALQAQRKIEFINEEVAQFVENSKKPIILFTLGSNLLPEDLDDSTLKKLIEAFRDLNEYNFICKFATEQKNLPKNVMGANWFQQNWLLANAKVKAIISHGGLLSVQEAIWHGKPILGIPLVLDQHLNIKKACDKGFAEFVDVNNFTTHEIILKLRNLVNDPSYKTNALFRSNLMRDRKDTPLERAVFWIEKVIKYKGLQHLQSPANKMKFYESYLLDIILLLSLMLFGGNVLIRQYHIIKYYKNKYSKEHKSINETVNDKEKTE